MPTPDGYAHQLFISYSSDDRAWAQALYHTLTDSGVSCFFDQTRLEPGRLWAPQLMQSVSRCRHFVVLWSDRARASDWVTDELSRFKQAIDPGATGVPPRDRLLFAINLQGQNATLASYQGFVKPALQAGYPTAGGPQQLQAQQARDEWAAISAEIAAAAQASKPAITMPVAVLALTAAMFQDSPPRTPELGFVQSPTADHFVSRIGAGGMAQLAQRYGADAFDWHPFGNADTIGAILDALLVGSADEPGINPKLAALKQPLPPVRWERLDVMTPKLDALDKIAQRLAAPAPCLIVIDPISMFSDRAWKRFERLAPCFRNPRAAIVFLTPSPAADPLVFLRRCVSAYGLHALNGFHEPIPYDPDYANCGLNIADTWDMRRLVLASLGRQLAAPGGEQGNPFLRPGDGA